MTEHPMPPKYYVIANLQYYPQAGMDDWSGPFESLVEAREEYRARLGSEWGLAVQFVRVRNNVIEIVPPFTPE